MMTGCSLVTHYNVAMCHHYWDSRNLPAHLFDEFSIQANLRQHGLVSDAYPLKLVPVVRLNEAGNHGS